ncbi:MAG: M48 family metalloprotease [Gammaproteobacteria bacterium]|jgi:predicted Zn-dependent protease|nr:M48 family metalloprotease [Gammaproteobacteria bacterium]MBP6051365.1 M48 family metalloprotease [Pseudomonadales bacterium]MBK6582862.1 M48 family metalloprotease [Gammaproteobacteria bacterium]MBK7518991.1 M48 family metalloprotease [Gammaproteobacteria bacterium]MBK7730267.1 M48 family metalloprotease [Gammaproteobacteria bacterium]
MKHSVFLLRYLLVIVGSGLLLGGCGVNPVTGSSEMSFMSEAEEIRTGEQQYGPSQQSEGGQYVLDPELTRYVQRVGMRLARVSDRPELPYEFVVLNNSEPNAWALPGGKIALNRGLLVLLESEAQLAAVLGHEIVHAAAGHGAQQQAKDTLLGVGLAVLGVATSSSGYQDLVMQGAQVGGALVQTRYSREAELEADHYGMNYMARAGYDPQGAVQVQELLLRLSAGKPQGGLFASHPPSQERVDANRRTARKLGPGDDGREEFQRETAPLRRDQPAYAAYDKGLAAMNAKRYEEALKFSNTALKLQDREALFHELRGVASAQLNRPVDAIKSYNQAIARNQGFFRPYLLRGMLHLKRGNLDVAREDLTVANRLFPTADATLGLGDIAARQGDTQTAIRYYEPVAKSNSSLAPAARERIAKLRGYSR